MAYSKDEAVALARHFLEELRRDFPIERAYLFGSYAAGRHHEDSDIDLAIVMPALNTANSFALNKTVFHRAMRFSVNLEPICFSPEEFESEQLPIVRDIKRRGVEVYSSS